MIDNAKTNAPGILISAPSSGTGKTTVMLGLLRALAEDGLNVQPFKSGPDYIDPAFHRAAAGRPSFNLDTWAMRPELVGGISQQSNGADIIVAEGSMGLFDGVATKGESGFGSSAETALTMGWPVVLVIDVGGQAQSAAATALGFKAYNPELPFAGVILNRCASPRHERLTRLGMEKAGVKVLGVLPRRGDLALPERHLGLIQAVEHPDLEAAIAGYAAFLRENVDLEAIKAAAAAGPSLTGALPQPPAQKIAMAQDAAFSFTYPHLVEGWRAAGAEIAPFSPLADEAPAHDADLVWLPGGYPELHAGKIAAATNFRNAVRKHAETKPVHGECGGYMALGETLIDKEGIRHQMLGLLGLVTSYEKRKFHLGYRQATLNARMLGYEAGARLRGHEFHYSTILEEPDAPLAQVGDADGNPVPETGSVKGQVTGTFFHLIAEATS
ncbi:cobyrinate a,c-diamide synthase [Cognatishimia activa]|uniref:Hydrogenobyrinate a,c-diamide synthase n=1 Tax=Cognatishimia activa TaxID=1715691 RepID=A0A0P1IQD2_9RHOB|nr:cobyrinate a,c-diamide synthase [Cognatishimia activa]CUI89316.1 Cobyrinic acid A,C-diamide synthase [Cognatishimia activa]CUK25666.1 Cobyrinic acid A,C-diamide synthase [Cognatishimia activa]